MSLHGGNIYDFKRGQECEILDFSSNINPLGPPPEALAAARNALSLINRYPDAKQARIREAFAKWLDVGAESLVFGNGASELIPAVYRALGAKRVLVVSPTFAEYEVCAARLGIEVVRFKTEPGNNFAFPMDEINSAFSSGDLLISCQPNNPTGRAWGAGECAALVDLAAERGGWLMADECFINLADPSCPSLLPALSRGRVVVLRAVTKDFSAPGLRIGFTASPPCIAARIRDELQPWPLNCVGEEFAIACARHNTPFLPLSRAYISAERERLTEGIARHGYEPFPSAANFILVRSMERSGEAIQTALLQHRILIRRCFNFIALDDFYFRVAVRNKKDNDKLLHAVARS